MSLDKIRDAQEAGRKNASDRSDFHMADIEGVCWTREEAEAYCKARHYNGPFFSYGISSKGILQELMKYTCAREIERRVKAEAFAHARDT
jgi:hypothetical protein